MSSAPIKKLPASPGVSSPSVPVADRGGEEANVGFIDVGAGSSNQLLARSDNAASRSGIFIDLANNRPPVLLALRRVPSAYSAG